MEILVFGLTFLFSIFSKPSQQIILDYDYTFTTPYCGSETVKFDPDKVHILSFSIVEHFHSVLLNLA